jgi:class 3 adenylate cyclase/putative methionine-R-sulfoxide reductase with GAF domain
MRRRSAGRKPVKNRRGGATRKTRKAPIAHASSAALGDQLASLTDELDEAREQQAATAEVLKVISRSTFDLQAILNTLVESAVHLCGADHAWLFRRDGDVYRWAASHGFSKDAHEKIKQHYLTLLLTPGRGSLVGRAALTGQPVQIADVLADPEYTLHDVQKIGEYRTGLGIPLLREGAPIGVLILTRSELKPFTDRQIELLTTFADQAVIAIENTRLLNELQQRTGDLSKALEQQTATSEVLNVISLSPGELEPVFATILDKALHLCEAAFGFVTTYDGERIERAAERGVPDALAAYLRTGIDQPRPGDAHWRLIAGEDLIHNLDQMDEEAYRVGNPLRRAIVDLGGARSALVVALRKDKALLGALTVYRKEVRPFTDQQVSLLQNFAAQAVIAIENARLLNELRASLEQQTATADVLRIISSSPGQLKPVFQAILQNATRICEATFGNLWLREGNKFRIVETHGAPLEYRKYLESEPLVDPEPESAMARIARTAGVIQIDDIAAAPTYGSRMRTATIELAKARTLVGVPMLKEGAVVGIIAIYRQDVRAFSAEQIALLQNFADQGAIAIENARLLNDLNKLNQQLEQRVADQVGEIERMSRLRRFLPPQVADLIVASGTEKQLESHRREITALFCDLRGFTGFSESSDPEDVMALLRDYHTAIGEIIIKYSGTLERYAGDGVMVIFNDPVPVENPALQAVLMALDMRSAIGGLIEKWRDLGHDIGFGIGIAHGFATLGTVGFEGRRDYAAIGTVSNVASRLCDEAKPGQILISPRVRQAVEKAVTVEPIGEFALKGIRRPMAAYNVLAPSAS